MDHHRAVLLVVGADVAQVEADGEVVVHLHRAQLPAAADHVLHHEVDLRAVERGLAGLLAGTALLIPIWDHPYPPGIFGGNPWIELHAALAIFSYAMFAIVALVSAMFLIQQHGLKNKQFKGLYQHLPSVQQLDLMARRLLITGVVVLSAALIFGAVFWINHPERVPIFKLTATCLVWAGYLTVIVLRIQKRLVTRRHAIASIALFIFALASLWPVQSARDTIATEVPEVPQTSE